MAVNRSRLPSRNYTIPVRAGAVSGDRVAFGHLGGICETTRDAVGNATDAMDGMYVVYNFDVVGQDSAGNAAIAVGDTLYIDPATGVVDANNTKQRYGVAMEPVNSGATTSIEVMVAH